MTEGAVNTTIILSYAVLYADRYGNELLGDDHGHFFPQYANPTLRLPIEQDPTKTPPVARDISWCWSFEDVFPVLGSDLFLRDVRQLKDKYTSSFGGVHARYSPETREWFVTSHPAKPKKRSKG